MKQIFQQCPVCKGKCYVQYFDFKHQNTTDGIAHVSICNKCNGTGYIETDFFVNDAGPYEGNFTINEEI